MSLLHQIVFICIQLLVFAIASPQPTASTVTKSFIVVKHYNESRSADEYYLVFKHKFRLIEDVETVKTLGFNLSQLSNWTSHHFTNKTRHSVPISLIKDTRANPDAVMLTAIKKVQAVIPYPLLYDYTEICNGCKNPAVVKWHGQYLAFAEVTRLKHYAFHLFWVNTSSFPAQNVTLFGITTEPNEIVNRVAIISGVDPRINLNKLTDSVELAYSSHLRKPPGMAVSELNMVDSNQQANFSMLDRVIIPDQSDFPMEEKNWSPFNYNSSRYFVQSINPLHVVSLHSATDSGREYFQAKTISKEPAAVDWKYGALRGGTNVVRLTDRYIALFHSIGDLGYRRKTYFFGAYAFSLHPPFRIIAISAVPIMDEFLYTGAWYNPMQSNRYDYVPYPVSLMIEKKGVLLMSFGMNDVKGYLCRMNIHELLESMVPVSHSSIKARRRRKKK